MSEPLTHEDLAEVLDELKEVRRQTSLPHTDNRAQTYLAALSLCVVIVGSIIAGASRLSVLESKVGDLSSQVTQLTIDVRQGIRK